MCSCWKKDELVMQLKQKLLHKMEYLLSHVYFVNDIL